MPRQSLQRRNKKGWIRKVVTDCLQHAAKPPWMESRRVCLGLTYPAFSSGC